LQLQISLVPVKYRINFTATIENFVWVMKQLWYYLVRND